MTCPSPEAGRRLRAAGAASLALGLLALTPPAVVWADPSPPTTATASPDPTTTVGAAATTLAGLSAPVRDLIPGPVRDIVVTVESVDGSETQKDTTTERTVILDSRVLFPEDRATLSAAAKKRLRAVADQIIETSATGTVKVDGYTDDQGSAEHGLVLSRQRANAVRGVLAPLLADRQVRIVTRGLGEANPRFPNEDKAGRPIRANQAKNRRVEITFDLSR